MDPGSVLSAAEDATDTAPVPMTYEGHYQPGQPVDGSFDAAPDAAPPYLDSHATDPDKTDPDGAYPDGPYPDGPYPDSAYPGSAYPGSTYPGSAYPDAATHAAVEPGAVIHAGDAAAATAMRLEYDERNAMFMHRLNVWKDELVAWFKTLASAAVYATLIVTFGFQVARVEGQSMAPTLADQDRLIVNKLAYRMGEPRRGDIVMLYYPLDPDKSFVKRVIAEENDQVRIVDGRVYVNDVPMGDDFVLPEYKSHDDYGPTVISEGYYFVMGDHRNNSSDSRHWGLVPKKYIIGRVQLRWWPVPTARVF